MTARHCTFDGTTGGIHIQSNRDVGGLEENVRYEDITMKNVGRAIGIACYYPRIPKMDKDQLVTTVTPTFRNIRIKNLTATSAADAGIVIGLPESWISSVVLEHVCMTVATAGLQFQNAKGVQLTDVEVNNKQGPPFIVKDAQVEGLRAQ